MNFMEDPHPWRVEDGEIVDATGAYIGPAGAVAEVERLREQRAAVLALHVLADSHDGLPHCREPATPPRVWCSPSLGVVEYSHGAQSYLYWDVSSSDWEYVAELPADAAELRAVVPPAEVRDRAKELMRSRGMLPYEADEVVDALAAAGLLAAEPTGGTS